MVRILIAEDDGFNRKVMASLLEPLNYDLFFSPNGQHALSSLEINKFDLIISDIVMPVMGGRGLVQAVQADPKLAEIPVIIMSGRTGMKEIAELLDMGANRFLPKPLKRESLTNAIEQCLEPDSY